MQKTLFKVPKMDCPSEENLIRIKLNPISEVKKLDFDLERRQLTVYHEGQLELIEKSMEALNLGTQRQRTESTEQREFGEEHQTQRRVLWAVLVINFAFFVLEMTTGLLSRSMGLVADSLDMLADAFVYAISLYAVGGTLARKKAIARLAGYFQIALALVGFGEVLRRFLGTEQPPDFTTMIGVSVAALIANGLCLYLLQKAKSQEAHMRASMIFTSNDIIINGGVIVAGLLVLWTKSSLPDLLVGSVVFALVLRGAFRILQVGK
ncbi:cation diffusion facilitator family transporter [Rhabdobacter roseus]|uniref:Co/Zn/Cd efflux system component n=1 Tax=Rhabdobacter roseus TaxID=1655419 RepID=A0A840TI91_9BACT|nr:cation diffusion facilitator family transporter [Rhabdobacter roseus]MBB5283031.1 Co/Zn/Cd efflux system component [Rhabdobacter roseus]